MRGKIEGRAVGNGGATGGRSGEENRHQDEDDDNGARAIFDELDETFIGLLVGDVVVAVRGRVGHFAMVCHWGPQSNSYFLGITANRFLGQRWAGAPAQLIRSFGKQI